MRSDCTPSPYTAGSPPAAFHSDTSGLGAGLLCRRMRLQNFWRVPDRAAVAPVAPKKGMSNEYLNLC